MNLCFLFPGFNCTIKSCRWFLFYFNSFVAYIFSDVHFLSLSPSVSKKKILHWHTALFFCCCCCYYWCCYCCCFVAYPQQGKEKQQLITIIILSVFYFVWYNLFVNFAPARTKQSISFTLIYHGCIKYTCYLFYFFFLCFLYVLYATTTHITPFFIYTRIRRTKKKWNEQFIVSMEFFIFYVFLLCIKKLYLLFAQNIFYSWSVSECFVFDMLASYFSVFNYFSLLSVIKKNIDFNSMDNAYRKFSLNLQSHRKTKELFEWINFIFRNLFLPLFWFWFLWDWKRPYPDDIIFISLFFSTKINEKWNKKNGKK